MYSYPSEESPVETIASAATSKIKEEKNKTTTK